MTSLPEQRDVDVLIIGSGAAGLCAALAARDGGAERVLVAEGEATVGGSSRLSSGLVMGAGTRHQRERGIDDDGAALFHDYMQINRWNVDAGIVHRLCEQSGSVVDWLGDLGVEYQDEFEIVGDELVPRVHVPVGGGQAIIDVLHRHCRERGVDIALGQRVDRLLVAEGTVYGCAVGDDEITSHAVIIATGGFGADPTSLAEFYPSAAATERAWYIGADGARGDALSFAAAVGAQMTGHDRGLRLLDSGFDRVLESLQPGWLVLVDRGGRRFISENAHYGLLDFVVREHGDSVFVIFDHATLHGGPGRGELAKVRPGSVQRPSPHWNPDTVEMMRASGHVKTADTIADLAVALGIDADPLVGTIERYNHFAAIGDDLQFCKEARFLHPVATPPFYGAELRPATVCSTAYGLRITPDAQVFDIAGQPIPGLYAAVECTGGVVGAQYVGSGNNYANCVVVGRISGTAAAAALQ